MSFKDGESDLGSLTEIHAFKVDDDSILLEWIFSDFRVGFSIEPEIQESSWYLVSNRSLGEISASGYIPRDDIQDLISWLNLWVADALLKSAD